MKLVAIHAVLDLEMILQHFWINLIHRHHLDVADDILESRLPLLLNNKNFSNYSMMIIAVVTEAHPRPDSKCCFPLMLI